MKNQWAFEEYSFPVRATVGTSYAVRFGIHRFVHSKPLPYIISTGSKPIFGHRSARSSRKRFSSSDWLAYIVIVASTLACWTKGRGQPERSCVSRRSCVRQSRHFSRGGRSRGPMSVDSQKRFRSSPLSEISKSVKFHGTRRIYNNEIFTRTYLTAVGF